MTTEPTQPVEIFYSYAHEDERLRKQLENHLSSLKQEGLITGWYDRDIRAGAKWASEIEAHLNSARIILLLVSPAFMASDYCTSVEMKRALERDEAGEAHVIPIILRHVDWQRSPIGKLQALPKDAKPVTDWPNRDRAFVDVVKGIRKAISAPPPTSSATSTSSSQLWNVPYRRNPFFTGREDILNTLHNQLQTGKLAALTQPQAISGLGGIGKTQTAVEYAYRYRNEYHPILWATAATRESLIADFVAIADLLHLPEKNAQDSSIAVAAVKRWLATHKDWLLILDNADDLEMASDFLPTEHIRHILLTTRAQFTGTIANGIDLEKMDSAEGTLLLLRRARVLAQDTPLDQASKEDRTMAEAIVKALDGLPLALDQAGAYIEETQCGLAGYLELYRTHRSELMQRRSRLRTDHPEPVATTWSLSFQQVEQTNLAAADLLRLCAFLDPDAIPEEIITEGASELGPDLSPVAADSFKLNEAIEELRRFSLIRRNPDAKLLNIHRLVQAVLKDGMDETTQRLWAERTVDAIAAVLPVRHSLPYFLAFGERTVDAIAAVLPKVEHSMWGRYERYLPHAQGCAQLITQWQFTSQAATRLLYQTGVYLVDRARYVEAEPLFQRALRIREQTLGPDHPDVAYPLSGLAHVYFRQGQYAQAEPLYLRALHIWEQALGPDHSQVAYALLGLADLYRDQGQYAQAEPLYLRALRIREQTLGPDHPQTADPLHGLAQLYRRQGQYAQAEPLFQRSLRIREQKLGPDHYDVALSLNGLAHLYRQQGQYAQAERLFLRALHIWEQALGPDHSQVAYALLGLAHLYRDQGQYAQAEPLYLRTLHIWEQTVSLDHPDVGHALSGLAYLYYRQGQYAQAESLYLRALHIWEQKLSLYPPIIQAERRNYASLLRTLERNEEAQKLEEGS